jgi:two-component system NtrC family response regulator
MLVEDDSALQRQLRWAFEAYELVFAEDRESAITQLRRHEPQVVLQDLGLPPDADGVDEGMRTLSEILRLAPDTKVIVATGNGDEDSALRAVAMGAYDFYQKPIDTDVLGLIMQRAFHLHDLEAQNRNLRKSAYRPLDGLIAASDDMLEVCRLVETVAPSQATVLFRGATGTGKEVLARDLHGLSGRSAQPFVAINCGAIPANLLESELFGHEKGAFTGAVRQTLGKIELADGGTLFLDEIGDMPTALQVKLLRFLQERAIERVGGRKEIPIDVRVVCATHQNLRGLIESGEFREDLYYRIAEVEVDIPPLRERGDDAVLLAQTFLEQAASANGKRLKGLSQDATDAIAQHDWPGNVRELENKVNGAVIMAQGNALTADDLGLPLPGASARDELALNLRYVRDNAERGAVQKALRLTEGNIARASRLLGVSRPALYDLLRKHGMEPS